MSACTILFADVCCRHAVLQVSRVCPHRIIHRMYCRHLCPQVTRVCLHNIIYQDLLRHACLQVNRLCAHLIIYQNLLQARVPAGKPFVPAPYYLLTFVAGAFLFTAINKVNAAGMCLKHACLHTRSVCLQHMICRQLLQAPSCSPT